MLAKKVDSRYVKVAMGLVVFFFLYLGMHFLDEKRTDFLITYVLEYRYTMLFIMTFIAGLIIPLPINVTLLAIGALAGEHYFNLYYVFLVTASANTLGNFGAYFFFRRFGHSILRDKYVKKYSFFIRLEDFFTRYAVVSILISRIIGAFGPPVNFLAGYTKYPFHKFAFFNIIGNSAFVVIFVALGYWLGEKWIVASSIIDNSMTLMFIGLVIYIFKTILKKPITEEA